MSDTAKASPLLLAGLAGISPYFVNGYVDSRIAGTPLAYWSFELLIWLIIPFAVFGLLVRTGRLRMADLGFRKTILGRRSVPLVVMASIVFCPVAYLIYTKAYGYARAVLPDDALFRYESVVPREQPLHAVVVLYFSLTAGFVEEMYYRALLYKALPGVRAYLILSPLLFAAIHWEGGVASTAAAYVYGLATALAFVTTRNIWPLIAGHVFVDCVWFG